MAIYLSNTELSILEAIKELDERLGRIEKALSQSLLGLPPGTSHQKKKKLEAQLPLARVLEGALGHIVGGRRTASAVAGIGEDCAGGAVAGALGHTERSAGGGSLLAPLGALPGRDGMEDHTQNAVSREKCKSPLKKNADVKLTHPLQALWNMEAPSALPKWLSTNATRKRRADALVREFDVGQLEDAIHRIANSDFLMGRNQVGRQWKASPEWFLRPGNVTRILEGEFDSINPGSQSKAVSGFGPSHPLHPDNIAKRRK